MFDGQVLKMERKVLNFLYFQLSVPTIKTFLRFVQSLACILTMVSVYYLTPYLSNNYLSMHLPIGDIFMQLKLLTRYGLVINTIIHSIKYNCISFSMVNTFHLIATCFLCKDGFHQCKLADFFGFLVIKSDFI